MQRGDFVVVALRGEAGKPRPALVVQADELFGNLPIIVVLPLTTDIADLPLTRVTVEPSPTNGLRAVSQVMVLRPQSAMRDKISLPIGRIDNATMLQVNRSLALLLGLA